MIKKVCGTCAESRKKGLNTVYCKLYGIYIRKDHECRYHHFLKGEKDADKIPQPEG